MVKVSDLTGAALDWAVAKALDKAYNEVRSVYVEGHGRWVMRGNSPGSDTCYHRFSPSEDWGRGGPIIERERIKVLPNVGGSWSAQIRHEKDHPLTVRKVIDGWTNSGPTPLIAAMRCYVASTLGPTVEISDIFGLPD